MSVLFHCHCTCTWIFAMRTLITVFVFHLITWFIAFLKSPRLSCAQVHVCGGQRVTLGVLVVLHIFSRAAWLLALRTCLSLLCSIQCCGHTQVLVLVWQALCWVSYTSLVPGQLVFNVTIAHSQWQNQVKKIWWAWWHEGSSSTAMK